MLRRRWRCGFLHAVPAWHFSRAELPHALPKTREACSASSNLAGRKARQDRVWGHVRCLWTLPQNTQASGQPLALTRTHG